MLIGRSIRRFASRVDVVSPVIGLNEEQTQFYNLALSFAQTEMQPFAAKWDEESHFPIETFKKLASLGFAGIYVKDDVGGSNLTR